MRPLKEVASNADAFVVETIADRCGGLGRRVEAIVRARYLQLAWGAAAGAASMVVLWFALSRTFTRAVDHAMTGLFDAATKAAEQATTSGRQMDAVPEPLLIPMVWFDAVLVMGCAVLLLSVPLAILAAATAGPAERPAGWLLAAARALPRAACRCAIIFTPLWLLGLLALITVAGPLPMSVLEPLEFLTSPLVRYPVSIVMCGAWLLGAATLAQHPRETSHVPGDVRAMLQTMPLEVVVMTLVSSMLLGPVLASMTGRLGSVAAGVVDVAAVEPGSHAVGFLVLGLLAAVLTVALAVLVIPWVALAELHPSFTAPSGDEDDAAAVDADAQLEDAGVVPELQRVQPAPLATANAPPLTVRTTIEVEASLAPGTEAGWWFWASDSGAISIEYVSTGGEPPAVHVAGSDGEWLASEASPADAQRLLAWLPAAAWWYLRAAPAGAEGIGIRLRLDLPDGSQLADAATGAAAA